MFASSIRQPRFALLLVAAWLIVAIALLVLYWPTLSVSLVDADDAMRLVQLRRFLAGQSWFDFSEPRLVAPPGAHAHWSRLIDVGLGGTLLLFGQFADQAMAERLMRAIWPLLWLLPTIGGSAAIAWRVAGREAALIALVLGMVAVPAYQQFVPGRIDHHNVQIALAVLTVAATAWSDRYLWTATAAGLLSGAALAIGFESLPCLACCGAAFGLRYIADQDAASALRRYGLALAVATLLAFFISVGPAHWSERACDAIALNAVAAIVVGGLGLAVCGMFADVRPMLRGLVIAIAAVMTAAIFVALEPRCLRGPFGLADPAIWPIWLVDVREMRPMLSVFRGSPLTAIAIMTFPIVALLASVALLRDRRRDFGLLASCGALVVALVVTFAALRAFSYAIWLGIPLVAAFAPRLLDRVRLTSLPARLAAALMLTPLVLSSIAITFASTIGVQDTEDFTRPESKACFQTASYAPLAPLSPGLIATDIAYGSYLLALTPHSVMAAPYHWLSSRLVAAHRALAEPPATARDIIMGAGARYVMICGPRPPIGLDEPARSASLWSRLQVNDVPDWLEPVRETQDQPFRMFRIRR